MASFQSAATVTAHLSPSDAGKLAGRYETVARTKTGEEVSVLRSLRHAPQEDLLLRARITPKKVKPVSDDIDGLCGMFEKKMTVTPKKKSRSKSTQGKEVADANKASKEKNIGPVRVNRRFNFAGF